MDFIKSIPEIENKIHYTFKDKSLLRQAFTRSSFCNEHRRHGERGYVSNEVLEFFGDSVLSTAIISMMLKDKTERYEHGVYTELTEGDFSNMRSKLSDKRHLSLCMSALGLQKYLQMGEGDSKLGIENEPSVMEDLFESIIGAVYIDCGLDMVRVVGVVSAMLDMSSYLSAEPPIQSYKNALQEFCADKKHRLPAPVYKTVGESGPDHKKEYERAVIIGERTVAVGKGKNLKLADSAAAEAALEVLKAESDNSRAVNTDSLARLKEFAAKNKQPSPEFRDLGESPRSNANSREYIIECRCMGRSVSAIGKSKQEARALAAERVLSELLPKPEPKPRVQRRSLNVTKKIAGHGRTPVPKSSGKKVTKSDKMPSPKRQPHQHKKHL